MSRSLRRVLIAVAMIIVGVAVWQYLPVGPTLLAGRAFVQAQGATGVLIFVVGYAVAVVLFAPATPLTLAAGALWGMWGAPVALAGGLAGAMISFVTSRLLLRRHCAELCARHPVTLQLDKVVARLGWKAVLLVGLSIVIPFSVQNYAFGMTGVRMRDFALGSFSGMVPTTFVSIWIGAAGSVVSWNPLTLGLAAVGTIAVVGLGYAVTRQVKQGLRDPNHSSLVQDESAHR
ncbi:MAG: TVP38/TMEM64 family protein [Burkholderiaceae bacterium]|nr:MAG: TVP38/TMEM64 family protein [Burkholderiaceae bacterium]TBR76946.1 MAG: TVP38/TMEM64 family protein [Burkholderiaceae bacterium]